MGVFVLVALQPIGAEPAPSPRSSYVVWDASAETITGAGGSVVDAYEGFVHASLTEAQVEALRESGYPLAIVNDLDLRVGGPACSAGIFDDICIGNAWITGTNEIASGKEHPADRINVEEAVYLCRAPLLGSCAVPTGDYTVRVQGFNVYESQPFAGVITGDGDWV